MTSSPRPGTLEWLADQQPDAPLLSTPHEAITRAALEARAGTLAEHLATEHGVEAGTLLTAAGRLGPEWFALGWAAAKLGAGVAGLPPGPVLALGDAVHVGPEQLPEANGPSFDAAPGRNDPERRLSGTHAPPDSITFSRLGRPVRRSFTPASVPGIGEALADLVARVRAAPGTTLVAAGAVSDPVVTFVANVVLVGGGHVLTAPTPQEALALAAEHGAELAVLSPADLDELSRHPVDEALDLTTVEALVTGAARLGKAAAALADDLFGAEAVIDVYATADTGVVGVRAAGSTRFALLDGVSARTTKQGLLEVRSPLAAAPGWVATGDRAAVVGSAIELL